MDIALFTDENMLPGLHATLYSALKSWRSASPLTVHLFHDSLNSNELDKIEATLKLAGNPFCFSPVPFSQKRLSSLKPFHGNWMAYGRLLLPELLPTVSSVVYLDCDLLVNLSLDECWSCMATHPRRALGAVPEETFGLSIDSDLCEKLGLEKQAPYFNSGVLYLNLDIWREFSLAEKCLRFASDHLRHDQAVLNCVFYRDFVELHPRFNHLLFTASKKISVPENRIYHFVGSPKPFDFLGNPLNANAPLFNSTLAKTAYFGWNASLLGKLRLGRIFMIRRSYLRAIFNRILNRPPRNE